MKCTKMARRALELSIVLIWLTGLAITPAVAALLGNTSPTMCEKLLRQKKYKEAFPYCRQAAEQGNAAAQFFLGAMYYYGQDLTQYLTQLDPGFAGLPDEEKGKAIKMLTSKPALAMRYLAKLDPCYAALPDAEKIEVYGMLTHGQGVKRDYTEAAKWWRKLAKQGDAYAQFLLGLMHESGKGVRKDYTEAVKWYRKAAEQGLGGAQRRLGDMYYSGKGVKKDYIKAAEWYRKAAEQGDANAQLSLGWMYENGEGVKKDYTEAAKWWRKAAEQGNVIAQFSLGWMYENGEGVKKDYTEAARWWRKLAKQGDAYAQFRLGWMYYSGKGVKKDYIKAAEWYRKAAEQGDANAQLSLGWMYENGEGVKKDYTEAAKWWRKAAEQGLADAQFALGGMYVNGKGVKKDYAEAARWWRKAAEQGYADAQFNLGVMYENGKGVVRSGAVAADWFYKAGLSYLKDGKRDDVLRCVEAIKELPKRGLTVPNLFLADKLLAAIYGPNTPSENEAQKQTPHEESLVALGTGWPVEGGYVVTNHHVIAGHKTIVLLRRDGVKLSGSVAMDDPINDLVLIRVEETRKLPPALPLARKPARVGARVFTVGYPNPTLMGSEPKVTDGIISSLTGVGNDPRVYQISVPLQMGNSGGPLLDMKGEVVGITTYKLSAAKVFKWTGDLPQNVNYAVKVAYLKVLVNSASSKHRIPVLSTRWGTLEDLAARIKNSVLIVIAK